MKTTTRKTMAASAPYSSASDGSSESDSSDNNNSGSNSDEESLNEEGEQRAARRTKATLPFSKLAAAEDASSSDEDHEDDDEDDSQSDDETRNRKPSVFSARGDALQENDGTDDDNNDSRRLAAMPLAERIQLEAHGQDARQDARTKASRQRKRAALAETKRRLEALAKTKVVGVSATAAATTTTMTGNGNDATKKKKKSKNRPTEASSKRAAFYAHNHGHGANAIALNESGIGIDLGAHHYKPHDPRGSNLAGHFDDDHFQRNYAFVDDIRKTEMKQLKLRMAARKQTGRKGQKQRRKLGMTQEGIASENEDRERLQELQRLTADAQRQEIQKAAKRTVKKQMQDQVAERGGGAFYLKRPERKHLERVARLEEVRKRQGDQAAEKIVTKRRKRLKSRDAKRVDPI
jgi:ribosomal RNA-processing protein 36